MIGMLKELDGLAGVPFWIGYAVLLVAFSIFTVGTRAWDGGVDWRLCLSLFLAGFGVVAPIGGIIFQAFHDFILAVRRKQLRLRHYALLLAIVGVCLVFGYIFFLRGGNGGGHEFFW